MYIANHYVCVAEKVYFKGEAIPDELPEAELDWLLASGAVHKAAPSLSDDEITDVNVVKKQKKEPETEEAAVKASGEETKDQGEANEEPDDEAEPPEIDVMSGIVKAEEEEKPKKNARTRKQTERSKTK